MLLVVCWMTHKSTWWCWFFVWSQIFVAVVVIDVIDDHNHVADDDDDNEDGDAGDGGCGGVDDGGIFGDGAGGNDTYDDDDDNNIRDTLKGPTYMLRNAVLYSHWTNPGHLESYTHV